MPAEVSAAMLYFKERTKGGSDIARGWQIYLGLVDMDVSCSQFIRDCQQDVNNEKELDAIMELPSLPTEAFAIRGKLSSSVSGGHLVGWLASLGSQPASCLTAASG